MSVQDLGDALSSAAVLQDGEHVLARGRGDVGVEVVDVFAFVPEQKADEKRW